MEDVVLHNRSNQLYVFWLIVDGNEEVGVEEEILETLTIIKELVELG